MEIDIKEKILKDFGTQAVVAIELINQFETKMKLSPRISRCIVHLASGDILKLKEGIKEAESDWRDIILLAENVPFEFNKPFKLK